MEVETDSGKIVGTLDGSVHVFRGIPYAACTGGSARFRTPAPVQWAGVRPAVVAPMKAPQNRQPVGDPFRVCYEDLGEWSEDCLALTVHTTDVDEGSRLPVMVFIHGGGFAFGSARPPALDGTSLAHQGVVLVTLHHRLNVFGFVYLGDDERFADAGNAGLLDIVAALQWVRRNISVFGGDPDNVTIFGQSGGGSKVALLLEMREARGLFHKAIIQSASSLLRIASIDEAERNTFHLLAALGLAAGDRDKLVDLPAAALLEAMQRAVRDARMLDDFRPVVDQRTLIRQPFDGSAPDISADIPVLLGWAETEESATLSRRPQLLTLSREEVDRCVQQLMGTEPREASNLVDLYRDCRPEDQPSDLLALVYTDYRYRRNLTRVAELRSRTGTADTYLYVIQWRTPTWNGRLRTPHGVCLPLVFGNTHLAHELVGEGIEQLQLQEQMSGAWVSFARTGRPDHPSLPHWAPFLETERATMVFDGTPRLILDPLQEERIAMEAAPPYRPASYEGGQNGFG